MSSPPPKKDLLHESVQESSEILKIRYSTLINNFLFKSEINISLHEKNWKVLSEP